MEINIKVSDQEILQKVMAGMNEDSIAKELIVNARQQVKYNITKKINELVEKISQDRYRKNEDEIYKGIVKKLQSIMKTNKAIKEILKSDRFDELMSDVLWEYVHTWIADQEINLVLNTPKKKKIYYPDGK